VKFASNKKIKYGNKKLFTEEKADEFLSAFSLFKI